MANRKKRQVIEITRRTGKTMNKIEFLIFGAMMVYLIVVVVSYLNSDKIRGYEIKMGSLSETKTYTGIAIRDEEVLVSPYTGYINYYVREGERVSTRDTVYSIDESGKLASLLNAGELGENSYTDEELTEFRSDIIQYNRVFDKNEFESVYDFKYDIQGSVIKLVNLDMYQGMETLSQSSLNGMVNMCAAGKTGYIVYNTDGYEEKTVEQLTAQDFEQANYEKKRISNNDLIEANSTVAKLITEEEWSLVIQVDEERAKALEEAEYVKIKFLKTQESSWAKVIIHRNGDEILAELVFNNSCINFCTERFVEIELVINDEEGLKIPNSAIVEKEFFIIPAEYMSKGGENGNYGVIKESFNEDGNVEYKFVETTVYNSDENEFYVDNENLSVGEYIYMPDSAEKMPISKSGKLIGVYNMNKGYADFKQITILYQNDEYAIVSSNTKYGLTVYDRIVLDASSVNTDDFVY
ncbi:MAG: HlyD family efflux transporter periplasmic adaptor subunit [Lachnospiraceae bacterium]|nr:HlyD family efflux transporter periplasmic adaptor subunit [Lachnospiraceae bacterium]